jgi:ABC-type enterochelin transport system substrate-binding protein
MSLTEIQRAITKLHVFASPDNMEGLVLIMTNGESVSIFTNESYSRVPVDFESFGFQPIIESANIYGASWNGASLSYKMQQFLAKTQYDAILEKAKSAGLTDDEIQILQQGK